MEQRVVPLLSADVIAEQIARLGAEIREAYRGKRLVLISVLKGSFIFLADLVRQIDLPMRIEFLGVQSYGEGTETTGVVRITQDLTRSVQGDDLLIVEDIIDTGLTVAHLLDLFATRRPASLKVCALLNKPSRARVQVPIDFLGFTIEDRFVVGYGLDWGERFRNLPFLGVVEQPAG